MQNLGSDIVMTYGSTGGDETRPYYIHFKRNFTVKEFLDRVLNLKEWGYVTVRLPGTKYSDYLDRLEYRWDEIITGDLSKYYDKEIKYASGGGGWSRSDYDLELFED